MRTKQTPRGEQSKVTRPLTDKRRGGSRLKAGSKKVLKAAILPASSEASELGRPSLIRSTSAQKKFRLEPELLLRIHDNMLRARVLEERLIRMFKSNQGYFWIGGPGEEAFNVPLGLQVKRGQGVEFDYLH